LNVASSQEFTGVRVAAQIRHVYPDERGRTVVNCNPNCNPWEFVISLDARVQVVGELTASTVKGY
jgi:hypothetical protein